MGNVYIRPTDVVRGDQTTAGRFAISRWGGPTTFTLTSATVDVVPTRFVYNNPRRVKLLVLNLGASDVYVAFESSVTTSSGIKLVASTGYLESNAADDGEEVISELWSICSVAGGKLMIEEIYRV